jgi:predicted PurR-regulated permease PerM
MERESNIFNLQNTTYLAILVGVMIYLGSTLHTVFAPMVFSVILSLVILPMVNLLERIRFNRLFSALTSVIIIALLLIGIGLIFFTQLKDLASSFGDIEKTIYVRLNNVFGLLPTNIQPPDINEMGDVQRLLPEDLGFLGSFFGNAVKVTGGVLTTMMLIPIFVFFILFYRGRISKFLKWLDKQGSGELRLVTKESKEMIQNYLSRIGLVILINATLTTTGLWAIGIPYALLLGVFSALLSVIPYVGTFVGALFPIAFAFLTKDSIYYGLGVMALYIVIQFVENNFTSPIILGNSLNFNSFAAILALLIMGQYWGLIGMVIAVPLMAVLVILIDHSEKIKSLNLLLKNEK